MALMIERATDRARDLHALCLTALIVTAPPKLRREWRRERNSCLDLLRLLRRQPGYPFTADFEWDLDWAIDLASYLIGADEQPMTAEVWLFELVAAGG